MSGTPRAQRAAVAAYRLILLAYPPSFRARCEAPMLDTFAAQCATAFDEGSASALRLCLGEYSNAIAGIWRSRSRPRSAHARRPELGLLQDLRFAGRRLRTQPSIVLVVTLTLGLAIAAAAAMFSIVDAALLRPSPFADADRLMTLSNYSPRLGRTYPGLSREKLLQWRSQPEIFSAVEAYRRTSVVVTGGVEPEELSAAMVSPGLFAMLGLAPLDGRVFADSEADEGRADVAVVAEDYWSTRMGRDPQAIGRILNVNGRPHRIVGVMPSRFRFPTGREQLWLPFNPERPGQNGAALMEILVRIAPGLTPATAQQRAAVVVARLEAERPLPTGWDIRLGPSSVSGPDATTRRATLILFGAVGLVLLTASANVANLLLSRAIDRQREFNIRLVLGARRGRIFRELLIEGLVLGLLAGVVGMVAAHWALQVLVVAAPAGLLESTGSSVRIDLRVFCFTSGVSLLTGLFCNLAPAFRACRAPGHQALASRTRAAGETPLQRRLRGGLVLLEVGLAVILLVGAALMVRSWSRLNAIEIGFEPEGLVAVTLGLDTQRYANESARVAFLRQVAADVQKIPGLSRVAIATTVPPAPGVIGLGQPEIDSGPCGSEPIRIFANQVSETFLPTMGIAVADGRGLRTDDPSASVVLAQSLANICGGTSLVGRRFRLDPRAAWLQVVGIAGDIKSTGLLAEGGELALYVPLQTDIATVLPRTATMIERRVAARRLVIAADSGRRVTDAVKRAVWARDPDQPILGAAPLADLMVDSVRRERFMLLLLTIFSGVALVLASAGIFGVLAYSVAQRTSEIGIRLALGASSRDVLRLALRQGVVLVGGGTLAGLAGAFALSRVLAGLLYEVDPHDPLAFAAIPILVFGVGLAAAWLPAQRATRVDPATALRAD